MLIFLPYNYIHFKIALQYNVLLIKRNLNVIYEFVEFGSVSTVNVVKITLQFNFILWSKKQLFFHLFQIYKLIKWLSTPFKEIENYITKHSIETKQTRYIFSTTPSADLTVSSPITFNTTIMYNCVEDIFKSGASNSIIVIGYFLLNLFVVWIV